MVMLLRQSVSPMHNMAEAGGRDGLHEPGVLSGLPESLAYGIFTSPLNIFLFRSMCSPYELQDCKT
ncbi:hypothetical protein E2C01_055497 [Portunus trituberculatus]|uniref:Uncharacterized protein n=1 Tax=Portunus trituberculatus TaxID=210409 RepID=A0A5B7GVN0_PORTR|nr:hypothetical protein [Portunus trituberculatus]